MCDFSLMHVKSRPASVGDKLTVKDFGIGTRGFAASEDANVAVCVLPGTEIAFDAPAKRATVNSNEWGGTWLDFASPIELKSSAAVFCQVDKDKPTAHHDALQFTTDHDTVLLNHLLPGQVATVLQLPAVPQTADEAEAQRRVDVAA